MSALHANSYKLIARSLGRSLAYIMTDQGLTVAPLAFVVTAKSLCADLAADNPRFDAERFWRVIEATQLGEQD